MTNSVPPPLCSFRSPQQFKREDSSSMTNSQIEDISDSIIPAALDALHRDNTERPKKVLLSDVVTATSYFQGRLTGLLQDTKESIRDGVTHGHKIPPLLVFGSVDQPVIVDGHHRLTVYREMQRSSQQKVSVEWVDGDFQEAQGETFRRNRAASKHLSTDERSQHAWNYLCTQASMGRLFSEDGKGTFTQTVLEMMELFALKKRATQNLRAQIKGLLAHLDFDSSRLQDILHNELQGLGKVRWWYAVKQHLQDYYNGVSRPETPPAFDNENLVQEKMDRWNKYMKPGWLTEPAHSDSTCDALLRMMSDCTKGIMFEHVFAEVSDETLAAAYAERDDLRQLSMRSKQWQDEDDHDDF